MIHYQGHIRKMTTKVRLEIRINMNECEITRLKQEDCFGVPSSPVPDLSRLNLLRG